jgi:ParB family chromosome partitioning protein
MASKTNAQKIRSSGPQPIISAEAVMAAANLQYVPPSQIRFSPSNYRRHMDQTALEEFAAEILVHGILSPLLVRKTSDAGFELVAGERRLRAALIAGISSVPVLVAQLDDEMVCEVQLAENLQRENPHPLHESQAIARMQQAGKTIDEIAARLGKSRKFVYSRIRLSELIEPFQQILLAAKMGVQQAYEIARLSAASQRHIFEQYCSDWQQEHFQMPSAHVISRFRCDLTRAPFDITIDNLVPATHACTSCPLNSATLNSLFPELASEAVCGGLDCYQGKVRAHFAQQIQSVTPGFNTDALVYTHAGILEELAPVLDQVEGLKDLPRYSRWGIRELVCPAGPEANDLSADDFMSQQEAEATRQSEMEDYEQQLNEYQAALASAECMHGLLISEKGVRAIKFLPDNRHSAVAMRLPTARQFQDAAREGTADS